MIHRLTIPNWRPARDNDLISRPWWTRAKLKKADKEMVAGYAKKAAIPHALDKRRVSLEIVLTPRQKEADPYAYCKSLLDALQACRLLIDDTAQFVVWGGVSYSRGKTGSTTIILEDVE